MQVLGAYFDRDTLMDTVDWLRQRQRHEWKRLGFELFTMYNIVYDRPVIDDRCFMYESRNLLEYVVRQEDLAPNKDDDHDATMRGGCPP